ncbi:MAG TPA: ornithine carbamoyltransferase [Solirubrobacteraceae bacterium]|nr:ornithine carbamoyltransferase [Solirubrobacteraceae bacterium]
MSTSTTTAAMPRDFLRIADLSPEQLTALLDLAQQMRSEPGGWLDSYPGELLACYFAKPSTRTRVSFEGAAYRLGMLPVMLRPDELQLGRGEPISDTARVLSGYAAAIVIRTFAQSEIAEVAQAASVPVINALSDEHHPCQALADLLTLRDHFGQLKGLRLAYVGDGNNVACSLMEAGALAGMHVSIASPVGYVPPTAITVRTHEVARRNGGSIRVSNDVADAVMGAHAVYTDVWVSMGQDSEQERRREDLRGFQVNAGLMGHAEPEAVFMHCLPAHRGQEVEAGVIDGPQSVVFTQAENRLPTEQAVIHALVSNTRGE